MNCNLCGTQPATIHLTEIVNNQMVEIHLCETCAQEKGTDFKTHFQTPEIIHNLLDLESVVPPAEKVPGGRCPECGMTYEEFGKTGRLGCAFCYEAFSKLLMPLIKRVQRSAHHIGKKPRKLPAPAPSRPPTVTQDLRTLRDRLKKSVQSEEFEEAARIRDTIKQLEEKQKKSKKGHSNE